MGYLSTRKQSFVQIPAESCDLRRQEWYRQAFEQAGQKRFGGYGDLPGALSRSDKSTSFTLARQLREPISGRALGVLLVNFNTGIWQKIFQDVDFNVSSIIGIQTDSGAVVYSNAPIEDRVWRRWKSKSPARRRRYFLVSSFPIADTGWEVFVLLSQTQLREKSRALLLFGHIYALAVGFAAVLIFILLSRYITHPFS